MKKLCLIIFILLVTGYAFGQENKAQTTEKKQESERKYMGPKEWKTYYRDSKTESSYKDVLKLPENNIEVMSRLEIGYACVYNHYRFNCGKKKWLQIEVAALPCGVSFKMEPGPSSNKWFDLNWTETGKEIKKLFNQTCKK